MKALGWGRLGGADGHGSGGSSRWLGEGEFGNEAARRTQEGAAIVVKGGAVVAHGAGRARVRRRQRGREGEEIKRKGDEKEKATRELQKQAQRQQGGDARTHKGRGGERLAVCERGVSPGLQLSSG